MFGKIIELPKEAQLRRYFPAQINAARDSIRRAKTMPELVRASRRLDTVREILARRN